MTARNHRSNIEDLISQNIQVLDSIKALINGSETLARQPRSHFASPAPDNGAILTLNEAAQRCGLTVRTLYRELERGTGPSVVNLTERRRGIFERDLSAWLLSRRRPAPGTQQPETGGRYAA